MVSSKKEVRREFRLAVFTRAGYRCECCGKPGVDRQLDEPGDKLDAHHIVDRHWFPKGGYVAENGISVCDGCHLKAEAFYMGKIPEPGFHPDELFAKIESSLDAAIEADANHDGDDDGQSSN